LFAVVLAEVKSLALKRSVTAHRSNSRGIPLPTASVYGYDL